MLSSKVRSIGTLPQNCMSCGRASWQKLFAGYIKGVRVTTSWGATWITLVNHLHVYFDLRVIVWSTVEGLRQTRKAARLPGQLLHTSSRLFREL